MPYLCRMNKNFIQGLIWLLTFSTGLFVVSLEPGYLDFDNLPDTNFSCVGKVIGGYYADLETNCQMFHVCTIGQLDEPMDIRFLCLNGTVFDQETRVCERIDEVDCSKSEKFYSLNLELYGNTQPPILEENADTESPIIEKSTPSTTTTSTTTPRPTTTTTTRPPQYFTSSIRPITPSPYHKGPSSHHFSLGEQPHSPEYTPEEINISLNPGAPPNIRTKPFEFPQHTYSDSVNNNNNNKKIQVTTHSSVFRGDSDNENNQSVENGVRISSSTTENYNRNIQTPRPTQNSFNFNFNYHEVDPHEFNSPRPHNYHYQSNIANLRPPGLSGHSYSHNPYRSSTHRNEYLPVTRKNTGVNRSTSTARSFFLQPIRSPSHQYFRTEKPDGEQLPIPVLPTLSPIIFSSPAPFTLSRHIETKRYTDEHELPPRIIISASASVSDASGRTLNYSLGTIGAAKILAQPPSSYDEYKEHDVVLDPFYHDVPKLQNKRSGRGKRDTVSGNGQSNLHDETQINSKFSRSKRAPQNLNPSDIIKSEDEAIEVLKFLFDWYKNHEKTTKATPITIPISPDIISTINEEFSQRPYVSEDYIDDQTQNLQKSSHIQANNHGSELVNSKNRFDIVENLFGDSASQRHKTTPDQIITEQYKSTKRKLYSNINKPETSKLSKGYQQLDNQDQSYKSHYQTSEYPKFDHRSESPRFQNEFVEDERTRNSVNRQRPYRGRHRFTVPFGTTESQKYPQNHEQQTIATIDTKNQFHQSNMYVDGHWKVDEPVIDSSLKVDENVDGDKIKDSRIEEKQINDKVLYNDEVPIFDVTEALGSVKETRAQQASTFQDKNKTTDDGISSDNPNFSATFMKPSTENYKAIYQQQTTTVQEETQNITLNKSTTKVPTHELLDTSAAKNNNNKPGDHYQEQNETTKPVNHNSKTLDYNYDADLELNRQESKKDFNQIHQKSTDYYGPFDTYDYVNDNYEPITYTEKPGEFNEQQLEKNYEDIVKGIIHEETHININVTEKPEIDTSVKENQTSSLSDINNEYYPSEDSFNVELYTSSQRKPPNKENNPNSVTDNAPKFKYIDGNLNSFADILKSLRDFQKYEQNIYDYNHNLTEVKEYNATENEEKILEHKDRLMTTDVPIIWGNYTDEKIENRKGSTNQTTIKNEDTTTQSFTDFVTIEYHDNDVPSGNMKQSTNSTENIELLNENSENVFPGKPPNEEFQLYTSKPWDDTDDKNTYTTSSLNYDWKTESPEYVPFGTENTETTSTNLMDTTTIIAREETTIAAETKTPKHEKEMSSTIEAITQGMRKETIFIADTTNPKHAKGISPIVGITTLSDREETTISEGTTTPKDVWEISQSVEITTPTQTVKVIPTAAKIPRTRTRGRYRYQQKHSDSTKIRIENNPETSYSSSYSRGTSSRRRNNRGKQQNKPQVEVFRTTPDKQFLSSTLPSTSQTSSTPIRRTFDEVEIEAHNTPLQQYMDSMTSGEPSTNLFMHNVTESLEANTSTEQSFKEPIIPISTPIVAENTTPIGFFITRQPSTNGNLDHTDHNISAMSFYNEHTTSSPYSSTTITENYLTSTDRQRTIEDTVSTFSTTGLYENNFILPKAVIINKTTEVVPKDDNYNNEVPEYTSTIEMSTPTTFESVEKYFTGTDLLSTTEPALSDYLGPQNYSSDSLNGSTERTDESLNELSPGFPTTTENIVTPMESHNEQLIEDSKAIDVSSTVMFYNSDNYVRGNEVATKNGAISEKSEYLYTTQRTFQTTNLERKDEDINNILTDIEQTTKSTFISRKPHELAQDLSSYTEELSTTPTYQTGYVSSTEKDEGESTTLPITRNLIENTTEMLTERTSILPSTIIEFNTQINIEKNSSLKFSEKHQHVESNRTEENLYSLHSSEEDNKTTTRRLENRDGINFSSRKAKQRLPKKSKSPSFRKFSSSHRFSTTNVTPKPISSTKSHSHFSAITHNVTPKGDLTKYENNIDVLQDENEELSITDAALPKNVKPTQGDAKRKIDLNTTPLSMLYRVQLRKEKVNKQFIFNCFGKPLNNFYSDPRDCRLFHYCTNGYTKNQLLDMKFVCDLGTHFDDEKLVCTREVPKRCL